MSLLGSRNNDQLSWAPPCSRRPNIGRQRGAALVVALLVFALCAALIVAMVPLWLVLFDGLRPGGQPWTRRVWAGTLLGFAGVTLVGLWRKRSFGRRAVLWALLIGTLWMICEETDYGAHYLDLLRGEWATGDAERFLSVLEAYRLAPEVTRERLHIEALESILDKVELILLDEDAIGNQILPFLPLTDPSNSNPAPNRSNPRAKSGPSA